MRALSFFSLSMFALAGCSVIVPGPGDFTYSGETDAGPRDAGSGDAGPGADGGPADAGDAGVDSGPMLCTSPEELCGGGCFDLQTSNEHCGDCTTACDPGRECRSGGCVDPVVHIGVAASFSCAVRASGRVFCWGANETGQLGTGDFASSLEPIEVMGLSDAVEVEAGATFSAAPPFGIWTGTACAVRRGGQVACWGRNDLGQLGDGTTSTRATPGDVSALDAAIGTDVAYGYACALAGPSAGILCWGDAPSGVSTAPTAPAGLPSTSFVDLAGGIAHGCAVATDGRLYCWGDNSFGQLGDGTQTDRTAARLVGLADVIDVAAGGGHTCAVTSSGAVSCWGAANRTGTGDTSYDPVTTPQVVGGLTAVSAVESGDSSTQTCAIHGASRSVSCWGLELVTGGVAIQATPLAVAGLENVVELGVGLVHVCALVDDGGVLCWGNNTMGRLGDGTTDSRAVPTAVLGFP